MAKSKNKKNISFIVITSLLGVSILIPVILLIVSTFMNKEATEEFTKSLYPIKYENYVEEAAEKYNVDVCLVYGIIRTESNFNPDAVSNAGAIGLMQIMPDTFTWLQNYRTNFEADDLMKSENLYDPKINIDYGTYFLSYLLEKYGGDKSLAVCAYNAGYGNVDTWLADGTIPNGNVSPDNVPFTETSNYLLRVTESMNVYREMYFIKLESYPDGTASILSEDTEEDMVSVDENNEYAADDQNIDNTYQDENIYSSEDMYYSDDEIYNYDYNYEY